MLTGWPSSDDVFPRSSGTGSDAALSLPSPGPGTCPCPGPRPSSGPGPGSGPGRRHRPTSGPGPGQRPGSCPGPGSLGIRRHPVWYAGDATVTDSATNEHPILRAPFSACYARWAMSWARSEFYFVGMVEGMKAIVRLFCCLILGAKNSK